MIVAAMAAYPLAAFGNSEKSDIALVGYAVAAYGLAIILFFGIPTLVFLHQWMLVRVGCTGALLIGLAYADKGSRLDVILGWSMICLTGIICGWMTQTGQRPVRTYVTGLLFILVLALVEFGPKWQEMMQALAQAGGAYVKDVEATMNLSGSSARWPRHCARWVRLWPPHWM